MADAPPRLDFMKCGNRYARDDPSIGTRSAFLLGTGIGWPPLRLVAPRRSGQGKSTVRFLRRPEPTKRRGLHFACVRNFDFLLTTALSTKAPSSCTIEL